MIVSGGGIDAAPDLPRLPGDVLEDVHGVDAEGLRGIDVAHGADRIADDSYRRYRADVDATRAKRRPYPRETEVPEGIEDDAKAVGTGECVWAGVVERFVRAKRMAKAPVGLAGRSRHERA